MIGLSLSNLPSPTKSVQLPKYDIDKIKIGIVHFGPGAFHRAHQAAYIDRLLELDSNYAICAVSLHSAGVKAALEPQDYLYTIAKLDENPSFQLIGSLRKILVAPQNPSAVIEQLADSEVRIVTSTITEKGYYLDANGALDFSNPEIEFDLNNLSTPKSFYGFVLAGLIARKTANLAPFVIIPCDNLSLNGRFIKAALIEFTKRAAPEYLEYVSQIKSPCTMVDSITPATSDRLREYTAQNIGLKDNWPIEREEFLQWVIEEYEGHESVPWRKIGVELTQDISQYEKAKLRILNGAHSSLAYFGLLKGHQTVYEAMKDAQIATYIRKLIFDEIIPNLSADFDLLAYANSVIKRFENPAIAHKISQIAWDGSKKLPVRIIPTILEARKASRPIEKLCFSLACWIAFIARQAHRKVEIIDPIGAELANIGASFKGDESDINSFTSNIAIFGDDFKTDKVIINQIKNAYSSICSQWEIIP